MKRALLFLALTGVHGCIPDYADAPTKLVGIGYDPEEIGPAPTPYGGVVEYSWVNFTGAGLSAAMMGLVSYDEVGPGLAGYKPPYAAVFGFSYMFDTKLTAADSLGGVTSVPPETDDSCYTTFEATGPIGSFKTVDVGTAMTVLTGDGSGGFVLDRYPTDYPPNPQDAFVYYIGVDTWNPGVQYGYTSGGSNQPDDMTPVVAKRDNFPFAEEVEFRFPGGMPPDTAPVSSIPLPSTAAGTTSYVLPDAPGPVMLAWTGPTYDAYGRELASGASSTCLAWPRRDGDGPATVEDCVGAEELSVGGDAIGQVYTGPWDTEDGQVTFRWQPGSRTDEYVSLAVRFLGPVDETSPEFLERVVTNPATRGAESAWEEAQRNGSISRDVAVPDGQRAPMACEDGAEYRFDDRWKTATGEYVPALRGNPSHNLSEVTCRLKDDGEFVLTQEMIAEALTYAQRNGAQGAIFYFARSTEAEAVVPAAKDQYNQRLEISPVKVTSRAIDIGRFWFEEGQ